MIPLIGHEKRWQALARAFAKDQIPQTLLLSGPAHVGKTAFVKRFARLLLCQSLQNDENGLPAPCGNCRICHQVEIETFPDFRAFRPIVSSAPEKDEITAPEILDSSIITVDLARRFGDEAMRKPLLGPRKVMVMPQADRMNEEAQNALLKTFEEPIRGVSYVLTTDNPRRLRATILSRAWHLPLSLAPQSEIAGWISQKFPGASKLQLEAALQAAAGRPGVALREMERLEKGSERQPRFLVTGTLLERLERASPVGALGLTEESLKWAREWWEEDVEGGADLKKAAGKVNRAAVARFLDELALAGRARWIAGGRDEAARGAGAARLDQIRKTRQYILRNANLNLALDVLFGRLIALQPRSGGEKSPALRTQSF